MIEENVKEEQTVVKELSMRVGQLSVKLEQSRAHLKELAERLDGSQLPPQAGASDKAEKPGELGLLESNIYKCECTSIEIYDYVSLLERL